MSRFHIIDDAFVILRSKGVHRQAKVYRRGNLLFANWGSGFIQLCGRGGTSIPNVSFDDLNIGALKTVAGRLGNPEVRT